jgi:hypothetical protein
LVFIFHPLSIHHNNISKISTFFNTIISLRKMKHKLLRFSKRSTDAIAKALTNARAKVRLKTNRKPQELISPARLESNPATTWLVRPLTTFTLFPHLPAELRNQIWALSIPGPRVHALQQKGEDGDFFSNEAIPSLLHVNRESRYECLTIHGLKAAFGTYVNFAIDTIYPRFHRVCLEDLSGLPNPLFPPIQRPSGFWDYYLNGVYFRNEIQNLAISQNCLNHMDEFFGGRGTHRTAPTHLLLPPKLKRVMFVDERDIIIADQEPTYDNYAYVDNSYLTPMHYMAPFGDSDSDVENMSTQGNPDVNFVYTDYEFCTLRLLFQTWLFGTSRTPGRVWQGLYLSYGMKITFLWVLMKLKLDSRSRINLIEFPPRPPGETPVERGHMGGWMRTKELVKWMRMLKVRLSDEL